MTKNIKIKNILIDDKNPQIIGGPCSIESESQVISVAKSLVKKGIKILRGGAYKPRTSPYSFQGLGEDGLKILKSVSDHFGLINISEVLSVRQLDNACRYIDIIQIGARNMQNFELLSEVGKLKKPIFLKRGIAATLEEFLSAAEYISSNGNQNIILCERGIRTFETSTRFTLDISAIPLLRLKSKLPVFADISHATGRTDIILPCTKAALAAGANGIMLEVHPNPSMALSDSKQQIPIPQFEDLIDELSQENYIFKNDKILI